MDSKLTLLVLKAANFAVKTLFTALLFCFVFPRLLDGVQFHGQFWPDGLIYAAVFALVAFILGEVLGALTVLTFGAVGIMLIFGFWLVPAIQLQVFSHYFSDVFTVVSWSAAIKAGFLLMAGNYLAEKVTSVGT